MNEIINLYIHDTELKKTCKITIPKNKSIKYLKYKIYMKYKKYYNKNFKNIRNLKIRYGAQEFNEYVILSDTNITNNASIFIKYSKLKGGSIGLVYGMITVPNVALIINILCLLLWCPAQYMLLMYGSSSIKRISAMKYSDSLFSNFNNFKLREVYDDMAKSDLKNDKFPNFRYSVLKSRLFLLYAVLYFVFVTFFSNIFALSTFIDKYGKIGSGQQQGKCFLYTDTPAIFKLGILILGVIPGIIIFLNFYGFQFGLIFYILTLIGGNAALLTSVYYKQQQNLKQALQYRDPMVPEATYTSDVNLHAKLFLGIISDPRTSYRNNINTLFLWCKTFYCMGVNMFIFRYLSSVLFNE